MVVLLVVLIGGYAVYNHIFPVAAPVSCPDFDSVVCINSFTSGDESIELTDTDSEKLFTYISSAKPTRRMSVNDFPTVRPYYRIELETNEKIYTYYIYMEYGEAYVEAPYEGIYAADEAVFNLMNN